jgi:hypothetical protein
LPRNASKPQAELLQVPPLILAKYLSNK